MSLPNITFVKIVLIIDIFFPEFGSATWHHRAQNLFGGIKEQIRTGEKDWPQKSWSGRWNYVQKGILYEYTTMAYYSVNNLMK